MTTIYITIDTEYSAGFFARDGADARTANFDASIAGRTRDGQAGIEYQMDIFDAHGLKAVFFVDPMPALIWGVEAIADVVGPIVARGHDVQLHVHTEWLAFAGAANPLGSRTGRNIKDFTRDEQVLLLGYAANALQQAGAPRPVAFRAGNYGANDDTLRALASLGISYDSSHCPALAGEGECGISLGADDREPMEYCGVIEVPVGSIAAHRNRQRHAQLTALSRQELIAAVRHSRDQGQAAFTLVSHSFELLSRDRTRINTIVRRRFEKVCARLAAMQGVRTATYSDCPPEPATGKPASLLPHHALRTGKRLCEQALGNALFGAR